jgi:hypothetical protein
MQNPKMPPVIANNTIQSSPSELPKINDNEVGLVLAGMKSILSRP